MKKREPIADSDLDVLFEHRNKDYGAYVLRSQYYLRLRSAVAIAISAFALAFLFPFIVSYLRKDSLANEDFETHVIIDPVVPKGFVTPKYLPPAPPPDIKNTPPKVVKDTIKEPKKEEKPKKEKPAPPVTTNAKSKDSLQNKPSTGKPDGDPDQISIEVDEVPSWASADYQSFQDYIQKNIKMPEAEIIMRHFGTVIVTATVNKDGSVSNVFISKGVSPGLNAEALRVIKAMPKLNPAIYHRRPVITYMKFPVTFLPPSQMNGK